MDKRKILVVEDDKAISNIVVYNLEREGFSVDKAYDGKTGLSMALGEDYDAVLLDVMMP